MERVLSYGDVLLRRCDVELLRPPNFINDHIIDFFFSYLSSSGSSDVLLVSPSTSFWITNCADARDLAPALAALNLRDRQMLLLPINNSADVEYRSSHGNLERGSHWSLLIFHRPSNSCLHFDSLDGANDRYARSLHARVSELVGSGSKPRFVSAATPQQENGHDCGAYVMAIAAAVKKGFESDVECDVEEIVKREVSSESARRLRASTLDLIDSLRREEAIKA
ncbi:NEDD8-specific protease 1-like [Selaginella moellendorffii]|uniref:NEDD8-specific protease 1-like n=1 Tax=Selaginella moellendorffii TaxID=88036 RepID=UPI000D1C61EA|nr:NEDD8-specific protease 1-like [Selaginella moellendorffii]|eukprot:XP_024527599.1 NEDD8-specific protease 1-like [Selaginella moellendorffii]